MSRALPAGTLPRRTKRRGSVIGRIVKSIGVLILFAILLFVGVVAGIIASHSRNLPDINRMATQMAASSPTESTTRFSCSIEGTRGRCLGNFGVETSAAAFCGRRLSSLPSGATTTPRPS